MRLIGVWGRTLKTTVEKWKGNIVAHSNWARLKRISSSFIQTNIPIQRNQSSDFYLFIYFLLSWLWVCMSLRWSWMVMVHMVKAMSMLQLNQVTAFTICSVAKYNSLTWQKNSYLCDQQNTTPICISNVSEAFLVCIKCSSGKKYFNYGLNSFWMLWKSLKCSCYGYIDVTKQEWKQKQSQINVFIRKLKSVNRKRGLDWKR